MHVYRSSVGTFIAVLEVMPGMFTNDHLQRLQTIACSVYKRLPATLTNDHLQRLQTITCNAYKQSPQRVETSLETRV